MIYIVAVCSIVALCLVHHFLEKLSQKKRPDQLEVYKQTDVAKLNQETMRLRRGIPLSKKQDSQYIPKAAKGEKGFPLPSKTAAVQIDSKKRRQKEEQKKPPRESEKQVFKEAQTARYSKTVISPEEARQQQMTKRRENISEVEAKSTASRRTAPVRSRYIEKFCRERRAETREDPIRSAPQAKSTADLSADEKANCEDPKNEWHVLENLGLQDIFDDLLEIERIKNKLSAMQDLLASRGDEREKIPYGDSRTLSHLQEKQRQSECRGEDISERNSAGSSVPEKRSQQGPGRRFEALEEINSLLDNLSRAQKKPQSSPLRSPPRKPEQQNRSFITEEQERGHLAREFAHKVRHILSSYGQRDIWNSVASDLGWKKHL